MTHRTRIRILHVDDNPEFTELTERFLEREDSRFTVETATNVDTGLEILETYHPDCIVSDYDMPGRDGLDFLQTVRKQHPDCPFVLFTGEGSEAVASEAISAGVTDYIQKDSTPEQFELLANRITNAVSARTSQQAAEEHLHHLEQVMKAVPTAITRVNRRGKIVFANERAQSNLGFEPTEVEGRTYNDPKWEIRAVDGGPVPDDKLPFQVVMRTGEAIEGYRHSIVWPDGERRIVEINGVPLFKHETNDDPESVVFAITDVTEQEEREQELERERDRLDKFASVLSHDLRNPLNVASGRLELANEECESTHHEAAMSALDRMETLISDLLTITQEGQGVDETRPVELADISDGCWRNVQTGTATLTLDTDRVIQADPRRLKQLLENLIRNAVEHSAKPVTVTVGDLDDGFYVEDDGPGIPDDDREQVFDAGYSTMTGGTGLGLSIAEQVARAHNWNFDLTDSDAGGARFEITGLEIVS